MLAYILAIAVGLASFALYMAAFFFPEVHRKDDFLWSGVGLFYALVLWVCADRITGGVLLGQIAGVSLLCWFGWENLRLRRAIAHPEQITDLEGFSLTEIIQQRFAEIFKPSPQPQPEVIVSTSEVTSELETEELATEADTPEAITSELLLQEETETETETETELLTATEGVGEINDEGEASIATPKKQPFSFIRLITSPFRKEKPEAEVLESEEKSNTLTLEDTFDLESQDSEATETEMESTSQSISIAENLITLETEAKETEKADLETSSIEVESAQDTEVNTDLNSNSTDKPD